MLETIKFNDEDFYEAADIIACIVFSNSSTDMGNRQQAAYWHGCENNMHAPCDMLARLGVMSGRRGDMLHHFIGDWQPGSTLQIHRHPAEPSGEDLALAILFYADWFRGAFEDTSPRANVPMPDLFDLAISDLTAVRRTFHDWAVRRAGAWLLERKLAIWVTGEGLCLDTQLKEHKILDRYWQNRFEMAQSYGGDEVSLFPDSKTGWAP